MQKIILFYFVVLVVFPLLVTAQTTDRTVHEQCATMQNLQLQFERNPQLKAKFEQERTAFTNALKSGAYRQTKAEARGGERTMFSIPVVFHIVATDPNVVTDAGIQAQLDTLNKDFFGSNGDSTKIPAYFKPLYGKSGIQFCLAQQTPAGDKTTGIERIKTAQTSFSAISSAVKHSGSGGADSWDTQKYYNVWLCILSNGTLGYATFPDDTGIPSAEQGVVIDYRSMPAGALNGYNSGKTLTHETGHYFNLYHIWGDDNGACTGTDYIDDTPNQADASKNCYTGIKTDSCTAGGNGIMYQNYMDYTLDSCLVMFTTQQVSRMESALAVYRPSLLTSKGCVAPVIRNFDARLASIDQPAQRICTSSFTPAVTIKNQGSQVLTSVNINAKVDNGNVTSYNWKGSLAYLSTTGVTLNNLVLPVGKHTLTIYLSNPSGNADEDVTNDTLSSTIQFFNTVLQVTEGFEQSSFPPTAWDIVNPDNSITWKKVTGISKTGSASVMMDNYNYNAIGENDDLRLPTVTLQNIDSAFLSFQVAAAVYTDPATSNNVWDTLQVLASTDCGVTYTSIYKKYGSSLVTKTEALTTAFVPAQTEWRKDSVNLLNYIGQSNVLFTIRNTNGYENNIYLDDINLRTVTINPYLKAEGILITPNPTNGNIVVQFYPQPTNLKALQIFSIAGQKVAEVAIGSGQANNTYNLNISKYAAGAYVVRAVFSDRVIIRKILKI